MKISKEKVMYSIYAVATAILLILALSGCTTIKSIAKNAVRQEVLVKAAVARYLHEHPKYCKTVARAASSALLMTDSKQITTVAKLKGYMIVQLNVDNLIPEEREIVVGLIDSVQKNVIAGNIADGIPNPGAEIVKARDFLVWLQAVAVRESLGENASSTKVAIMQFALLAFGAERQ